MSDIDYVQLTSKRPGLVAGTRFIPRVASLIWPGLCLVGLVGAATLSGCIVIDNSGGQGGDCSGHGGHHGEGCTPSDSGCDDDCRERSYVAYDGCVSGGGSTDYCSSYADEVYEDCQQSCGSSDGSEDGEPDGSDDDPTEPDGSDGSGEGGEGSEDDPAGNGGEEGGGSTDPETGGEDLPPPTDGTDPECLERCEQYSRETYESCVASGEPQDVCAERSEAALRECQAGCQSPEEPPPPSSCQEHCEAYAQDTLAICIDRGGSREQCQMAYDDALKSCMSGCEEEPPPPSDCPAYCNEAADQAMRSCLEEGGSQEACHRVFDETLTSCLERCEGEPPPEETPPPEASDCQASCDPYAHGVYSECMVTIGDPITCEDHAQLALQSCMYGCTLSGGGGSGQPPSGDPSEPDPGIPPDSDGAPGTEPTPPPTDAPSVTPSPVCEERCEAYALDTYDQCIDGGNSPDRCKERYYTALNDCLASCTASP